MAISSQAEQECSDGSTTSAYSPERTMEHHERAATRRCSKCKTERSLSDFYAGTNPWCKPCNREYGRQKYAKQSPEQRSRKQYYQENRDRLLAQKSEYGKRPEVAERDKARRRERYSGEAKFRATVKNRRDRYYAANQDKFRARDGKRRARQHRSIPLWADRKAIVAVYRQARQLRQATGLPYEVDHFFPLQGKTVSGLHVESNLRIVLMGENRSKFNSIVDDMA